jgi:hypothetical protein
MGDADRTWPATPAQALTKHGLWQEVILSVLHEEGFAVVPQADVDAATRLRTEALEMRVAIATVCSDGQMVAISNHMDRWAAAAVGSVEPEDTP